MAGRRAPTLLIVGTLVASVLSTNIFLGETGFVYEGQAGPYLLWPPIAAMGYIFGALLFGRYLRRSRAITVADYFGQRFNSQRVQTAAVQGLASLPEKPDLMAWHGIVGEDTPFTSVLDFTLWNITLALAWGLVYAVSPWQSSRYLIARDEHTVVRASCIAAIFLILMELTLYSAGAVINLSDSGISLPMRHSGESSVGLYSMRCQRPWSTGNGSTFLSGWIPSCLVDWSAWWWCCWCPGLAV